MDPITLASRTFQQDWERFWRLYPRGVLRAVCTSTDRGDLVKTLRLVEWSAENRCPLVLYEAPFTVEDGWFNGLADKAREDYEAVRKGAAEEGVTLDPLGEEVARGEPNAIGRAARTVEAVASRLRGRLDGVIVALAPTKIQDATRWRAVMEAWVSARLAPEVRRVIHDVPGGPLEGLVEPEATVRFAVDQDALMEHLGAMGSNASAGPPVGGPPPTTEAQRKAFEETTGRRLPTPEGGRRLRALLMEGAQKLGRGDHLGAAQAYRGARDLCRAEGLVAEEAMVLVAIASLALATGSPDRAREAYERAASLAEGITLWQVVAQAWMGVGGVFLVAQQYLPAAAAYERAAEAAEKAKVDLLRIESLRMAGTCHLSVGDEREATRCWRAAVETGQASDPATREAGTFGQTAEALAALLDRRGLTQQAAHVRAMVKARA